MTLYDIISPDGFSFFMDDSDLFATEKEAQEAIHNLIVNRYSLQGYYNSNNGRLSLQEAINQCTVIPVTLDNED